MVRGEPTLLQVFFCRHDYDFENYVRSYDLQGKITDIVYCKKCGLGEYKYTLRKKKFKYRKTLKILRKPNIAIELKVG